MRTWGGGGWGVGKKLRKALICQLAYQGLNNKCRQLMGREVHMIAQVKVTTSPQTVYISSFNVTQVTGEVPQSLRPRLHSFTEGYVADISPSSHLDAELLTNKLQLQRINKGV